MSSFSRKPRYEITVEKNGPKYHLYTEKKYGDGLGIAVSYEDPQQILAEIRRHLKLWQGYDAIVMRVSDLVTEQNTAFTSNTTQVTAAMVFHPEQKTLMELCI